jgi:hypothetical protein
MQRHCVSCSIASCRVGEASRTTFGGRVEEWLRLHSPRFADTPAPRSGCGSAALCNLGSVLLQRLAIHFSEGMFVEQVRFDSTKLLTVIDLNPNIVVERTNGRSLIEKDVFRSVKDL